ncbi:MAG: ABC transporter ATP-binding protein [Caldilineae bacterium]|nr:ABC transporter ATP-binding protein [Anaerolineae bacterium]MCB9153660.1 ABC transporter ATP-binding protein [Caldilineae bacterium]
MLTVENLQTNYGAIRALKGVSFHVDAGATVTLIGANGAGKSTTLNTISGLLKPAAGRVVFNGTDITGWRADRVTAAGLVQVPEGREILAPLTVAENLELGAYTRHDKEVAQDMARILARFPRLAERRDQQAGSLSGGEQQMLAIGRALMARPKLLMLDEPSMGLAPVLVRDVFDFIAELQARGTTILLVEQNARKALRAAGYAYVLENGLITQEGTGEELLQDARIVEAYLGSGH